MVVEGNCGLPRLGKIKPPSLHRCMDAVAELSRVTAIPWKATPKGWGGYLGLIHKGVCFVMTHTLTKPPLQKLVAWPIEDDAIWLPSERDRDLAALCKFIGETSLSDFVLWHEFVNMDFGFVEKRVPPRLLDSDTCLLFEIDIDGYLQARPDPWPGTMLWWQEWGGLVFRASLLEDKEALDFRYELLARNVGKYKRIPTYLRR